MRGRPRRRRILAIGDVAMTTSLSFDPVRLPRQSEALRADVRAFLAEEISAGTLDPHYPGHGDSYSRDCGPNRWR